jgi:hypothetical protein
VLGDFPAKSSICAMLITAGRHMQSTSRDGYVEENAGLSAENDLGMHFRGCRRGRVVLETREGSFTSRDARRLWTNRNDCE